MDLINLKDDLGIDKKLEEIWSNRLDSYNLYSPIFPQKLRKNSITFLSLNPSLQPKDKDIAKKGNYPDEPYPFIDSNDSDADYIFFQKFYEIGKNYGEWTVLDLLFERNSNQGELEKMYGGNDIKFEVQNFLLDQIKLTFEILTKINPRLVIVCNAFAAKLIHKNLPLLNLKVLQPSIENNNIYRINGIPFIINESKFLGSRYLANNSRRRAKLNNEIDRVLKEIKKNSPQ